MPLPDRVVVTGMGQASALGLDLASFARALFAGDSGVRRLELDTPGLAEPIGAAICGFDPAAWLPGRSLATIPRGAQYAYVAASQAFASARLERRDRLRGGVYLGTGFGGIAETEETYRSCFARPGTRPRPTAIPTAMANAPASFLASEFRLKGPNLTFAVACSSANHAIGQAFHLLRGGGADVMLAGGTEASLTPIVLAAWNVMRVLAPAGQDPRRACRPFAADRRGLAIGEGAGLLVLETLAHAEARGAAALAEVVGYGANADAGHVTHPDPESVRACMALALADAGLPPEAVGYLNAHGTGTEANDRIEAEAVASLFGERVAISSTKAVHGHAMGASGGLEAIATILALREGRLPPTANVAAPDPALPALDYVLGAPRTAAIDVALSNSFAFGGNNAVLALRRAG
jgi:3-oxoacyl-(acyl-carrier-protein) synthase